MRSDWHSTVICRKWSKRLVSMWTAGQRRIIMASLPSRRYSLVFVLIFSCTTWQSNEVVGWRILFMHSITHHHYIRNYSTYLLTTGICSWLMRFVIFRNSSTDSDSERQKKTRFHIKYAVVPESAKTKKRKWIWREGHRRKRMHRGKSEINKSSTDSHKIHIPYHVTRPSYFCDKHWRTSFTITSHTQNE